MNKQYNCRFSRISILVNVDDKVERVTFEPSVINDHGLRGCSFATDDKKLQDAIEAHPDFKSGKANQIWTDNVEELVFEVAEEVVEQPVKKTRKKKEA